MKSLPYFPFYPGEWLRSPTVLGMSLLEQGAYLRLLCVQWEDGYIDPEDVPLILGLDDAAVIEMLSRRPWKRAFPRGEDGMLRNPRLAADREVAAHKVEGAQAAAKARWDKHKKKGSPNCQNAFPDRNIPFSPSCGNADMNEGAPPALRNTYGATMTAIRDIINS